MAAQERGWVGDRHNLALVVAILLLAAFLRLHDLDAQSFWNDEGNSARIVERPPALIVEAAAGDIHPPLYYLALAGWRLAAGFSEFALRAFSAACGVLTVALTFALGRHLFGVAVGRLGALIVAAHAFQVYYSQEARMYALMAALGVGSMYAFVRWLGTQRGGGLRAALTSRWALVLIALNTTGLYTQYAFPAVLLVQAILFAGWWGARPAPRAGRAVGLLAGYAVVLAAPLVLYSPWLPIAARQITSWPAHDAGASFLEGMRQLTALLVYGLDVERWGLGRAVWAAGIPLIVAAVPLLAPAAFEGERGRRLAMVGWRLALLWMWLLLPIAGVLALGLFRPAFLKMLLIGHAPLALLIAWGLVTLVRASRLMLLLALLCLAGLLVQLMVGLHHLYNDPAQARADYRAIAADIAARARPGDAVLLNAANQWEVFTYYHREDAGGVPVYPIPRERPVSAEATHAELDDILAAHERLFVLYWGDAESDPERVVERHLSEHAAVVETQWYKDVRLVSYVVSAASDSEPLLLPGARFGAPDGVIHLVGFESGALGSAARPGDALALTLLWKVDAPLSARYKVFVHLVDAAGRIVAQHDSEPVADLRPTATWQPGETIRDHHGLLLPKDAAPGEYGIYVGLYSIDDPSTRLPVILDGERAGDYLMLGTVTVQ